MKFRSLFRVCLIFSAHTILPNFKSIGNNTMKKKCYATALALLITGCAQQTFTVQNKPAAVAPETITHHFFVSGIGQKTVVQPKFVWRRKCYLNRNPANIRKWIARFVL